MPGLGLGQIILGWPEWPLVVAFPSLGGAPDRSPLTPQSQDDIAPLDCQHQIPASSSCYPPGTRASGSTYQAQQVPGIRHTRFQVSGTTGSRHQGTRFQVSGTPGTTTRYTGHQTSGASVNQSQDDISPFW